MKTEMPVLTIDYVPGYEIEYVALVTSEGSQGINVVGDWLTSITDVVGGKSKTTEKSLDSIKKYCIDQLIDQAFMQGADAIVGLDIDYTEFSAKGKSMLIVAAAGTAVKVIRASVDN